MRFGFVFFNKKDQGFLIKIKNIENSRWLVKRPNPSMVVQAEIHAYGAVATIAVRLFFKGRICAEVAREAIKKFYLPLQGLEIMQKRKKNALNGINFVPF